MSSSALAHAATAVLECVAKRRWGYPPQLMAAAVAELGPFQALRFFARNFPRYLRTIRAFGEARTYLLCLAISLLNDCEYCVFSYSYALQLAYLREHERLFPCDEAEIDRWRGLPPAAIRSRLTQATLRAGLHGDVRLVDRVITLSLDMHPRPTEPEELKIVHLIYMFRVLNSVAIARGIKRDEAPTPLNKDTELKLRYAKLRSEATK